MRENGIPARIDRSVMPGQSGANQTYLLTALRFFGLIDDKAAPTNDLKELVESKDDKRKETLKRLVERGYSFIFESDLDLMKATEAQLHETFRDKGLGGDTLRKCHSFFVSAAEDAGIPLGKHLKPRGVIRSTGPRRRSGKRRAQGNGNGNGGGEPGSGSSSKPKTMREMLLEKFPQFDPNWPDEIKSKWFAGFEKLMKSADEDQA